MDDFEKYAFENIVHGNKYLHEEIAKIRMSIKYYCENWLNSI